MDEILQDDRREGIMRPNKEEINLSRKIAEKHRKEIRYGDWYIWGDGNVPTVALSKWEQRKDLLPLWQISDCLEFLQEKCKDHVLLIHDVGDEKEWWLWVDEYKETQQMGDGKTPLEACLKAVLATLKEKE